VKACRRCSAGVCFRSRIFRHPSWEFVRYEFEPPTYTRRVRQRQTYAAPMTVTLLDRFDIDEEPREVGEGHQGADVYMGDIPLRTMKEPSPSTAPSLIGLARCIAAGCFHHTRARPVSGKLWFAARVIPYPVRARYRVRRQGQS